MRDGRSLEQARELYDRRLWRDAYDAFTRIERESPLDAGDLERLATAAFLTGQLEESADAWGRAHQALVERGEVEHAARCAFWLAFQLLNAGEMARGSGWLARARRLLDDRAECATHGYLLLPLAIQRIGEGDHAAADAAFAEAAAIAERFADANLLALARNGRGRAHIRMGRVADGVTYLDEAMVAIEAGELSPIVVGDVYCSVISGCLEIFDLRRAHEWTRSLARWCDAQPGLVAYDGQCLLRRAEIMQLHGTWPEAIDAARRACERLVGGPDRPSAGAAFYQLAELHRLRGELARAEESYRQASRLGRKPQPGLALLRLAQGDARAAASAIRVALEEAAERRMRSRLLPAFVEIALAAGDVAAARAATDELATIARDLDAPFLVALAAQSEGAVLLAEDSHAEALAKLRRAWAIWQELDAPYEGARVRVLTALALRAMSDHDGAAMELDAARWIFERLGATADVEHVRTLVRRTPPRTHGLSRRELEVLQLVATGETNRAIAHSLAISEKTVARHVANIFTKLGVSTRAAATAYAYEHDLARRDAQNYPSAPTRRDG